MKTENSSLDGISVEIMNVIICECGKMHILTVNMFVQCFMQIVSNEYGIHQNHLFHLDYKVMCKSCTFLCFCEIGCVTLLGAVETVKLMHTGS